MMGMLWDLGRLLWLALLITAIVWAPAAFRMRRWRPSTAAVVRQAIVAMSLAIAAVTLVSPAHLLNPLTLFLACSAWPLAQWVFRHRGRIAYDAHSALRATALRAIMTIERAGSLHAIRANTVATAAKFRTEVGELCRSMGTPSRLLMAGALTIALMPVCATSIANARLPNAQAYGDLLQAQQLYTGDAQWGRPRVVPALTAAISVVSAIAPVNLIRLLVPIAAAGAFLLLIATVRATTAGSGPAVVAVLAAAVLAPLWPRTLDYELTAILILLSIVTWHRWLLLDGSRWRPIAATVLLALHGPGSLLIVGAAVALMLIVPSGVLIGAGILSIVHGSLTGGPAPYGWSLIAAGVVHVAATHLQFSRPPVRVAFATAVAILGLAIVLPRPASADYVEYDAAARNTLEIASRFPKYRWMIAAPIEEWALSYGHGWHLNLHEFVEEVAPRAATDGFRLPYKVDDLFVFVETRPFARFETEPADVPFQTLIDPVFRHYRSPAGRASLQFAAYKLSERLREITPGASVYFDDGRLKIYRFRLR